MKIILSEILPKKILFLVYGGIFILSTAGYADFDTQKKFSNNTNFFGRSTITRIDYKANYPLAIEEAIFGRPNKINSYDDFQNEEILSDEGAIDSEQVAQQMMEQALTLCQLSQNYWQRGELNKAIELLDQAYLLILGINKDESDDLIQQKEDLRFMISKRIIEI
ncbi:MAG: hypothetical protein WCB15_11680, partial [Desulfobacterales bacterium]